MKRIWIIGLLLGVAGIIGVRSWWFRAEGNAEHIPAAVPGEPIENFLPTGPATQPTRRPNPLSRIMMVTKYQRRPLILVIEDIAATANIRIEPDWRTIRDAGVEPAKPVTLLSSSLPVSAVLKAVLRQAGGQDLNLVYWIDADGVLRISTSNRSPGVLGVYNVRDILVDSTRFHRALVLLPTTSEEESRKLLNHDDAVTELKKLITENIDPGSWIDNGGKVGTYHYFGGKLVIVQTEDNHAKIEEILADLRRK